MARLSPGLRRVCLDALYLTGAHRLAGARMQGRGAILMFHSVRPDPSGDFAPNAFLEVTPDFLRTTVRYLRENDFDIIPIGEVKARLEAPQHRRRFAVITFDDGYRDNFEHAYPVLKEEGCPFTVYVATGFIDRTVEMWWRALEVVIAQQDAVAISLDGPVSYLDCRTLAAKRASFRRIDDWLWQVDEDRQRATIRELAWRYGVDLKAMLEAEMMGWDEVRRLAADPLVTIGAHTIGHYALARLSHARARAEMRESARVIEAVLGTEPRHFAYPYGFEAAAGEREFGLARELGFATAVTTRPGVLQSQDAAAMTALPRVSVNGHFQSVRYLDLLLSGLPFVMYRGIRRVTRGLGRARPGLKVA